MTMIAKSRGALVGAFAAGIGGIVAAITVREYNVRESSASKIIDTLNGEGLDGQLAYRFAHPIHKSDAPHIQRQITSAKIQNRQSEQYYGGYSGEYLAHKNA
ncbi:hypothetical protein T484DRAFT_1966913 [Baffinella frigidus]|nr:hypothetical protein T484DRAFT_1966913 [Cryptophyta sp. CCMP2293]